MSLWTRSLHGAAVLALVSAGSARPMTPAKTVKVCTAAGCNEYQAQSLGELVKNDAVAKSASAVVRIEVQGTEGGDVTPLAAFAQLEDLEIHAGEGPATLAPLAKLTKLRKLQLQANTLTD